MQNVTYKDSRGVEHIGYMNDYDFCNKMYISVAGSIASTSECTVAAILHFACVRTSNVTPTLSRKPRYFDRARHVRTTAHARVHVKSNEYERVDYIMYSVCTSGS